MANQWYPKAGNHVIDVISNNIKWAIVTAGYTFSTSDEFVTDLGANIVGRTANLGTKTLGTVGAGVFDAADSVFTALTGSVGTQLVMFKDSGSDATSPLMIQVDSAYYPGLPFTPVGTDVPLLFPAGGICVL